MATLLIAHPDERLTEEVGEALGGDGHRVVAVRSGEEAVRRAIDAEAEVILVSSHLPDKDGREVCRLLREAPGGQELAIVAIGPEFWEHGVGGVFVREVRVDGFVALPCRRSTLLAAVDGVLERFRRGTPLPAPPRIVAAVERVASKLEEMDYYALLGIGPEASVEEIRDAFHRVSGHYHPDRYHIARDTPLYQRVQGVFKRMAEAYNALVNPEIRARYDEGLGNGELRLKTDAGAWGEPSDQQEITDANAKRFYDLGRQAEEGGDARTARMNFAFALTYEPDNSLLQEAVVRSEETLGIRKASDEPRPASAAPAPTPVPIPPLPAVEPEVGRVEEEPQEERTLTEPGRPSPVESDVVAATHERPAESPETPDGPPADLPRHLAIIMDGNGRWAEARGKARVEGHQAGAEAVRRVVRLCRKLSIPHLTLYAFSEQNWSRPDQEVAALMELLAQYVQSERGEILDNDIRLLAIGDLSRLPGAARAGLVRLILDSKGNRGMTLCLALSYGGREEILAAARKACEKAARGDLDPAALDAETFRAFLDRPDLPDPDLVVRTSGELRVSNFLLWQIAYSELYVTDTLWPDFGEADLLAALDDYAGRERRFGRTGEQVRDTGGDG